MSKYIFEQKLFLGFVTKVSTKMITAHIPSSKYINKFFDYGDEFHGGLVNSFVVLEGEKYGFICRVVGVEIPEKERLEISTEALKKQDFHPLIKLEIQSMFSYQDMSFIKSLSDHPNVGAKVYIAREEVINLYLKQIELKGYDLKTNKFATLLSNSNSSVDFSLQNIFSRHAAIVGTTGSGKSWTTAMLVENMINNNQKVMLLDATGEYEKTANQYKTDSVKVEFGSSHFMDYKELTLEDLFYLVKPSTSSQFPKLKAAIKSLKLLEREEEILEEKGYVKQRGDGVKSLIKKGKRKDQLKEIEDRNAIHLEKNDLNFNILALPAQIENECVWDSSRNSSEKFGDVDNNSLGFCTTLITRINALLDNQYFEGVFNFSRTGGSSNLSKDFEEFLENDKNLLYINLKDIPFLFDLREVVADTLAKKALSIARIGKMKENPCLLIVDEAHQFMNKTISNDYDTFKLEAFDSIAKEGRKYGLFLCITTQLPRDIPLRTLSQIGTFIVHRIINQRDKEIIQNSLPVSNQDIVSSLSELGQGEILLSSIDIKQPLMLKVAKPKYVPDSNTPIFK
ncbi:ATP-binding protein [Halobacillus trueperi]|nr:ATP-binding protein [Halobacillus trueperi]